MGKVDFVFSSVMNFVMLQLAVVSCDAAYRKCTLVTNLFFHSMIRIHL